MYRAAELLSRWVVGAIGRERRVVRDVTVRAPISFELSGGSVEHRDSAIAVPVRDVGLVCFLVDRHLRDPPEVLPVVAARTHPGLAQLHEECSIPSELQDVRILRAVSADPDVVHGVDRDAVVGLRPVVALTRPAPRADQITLLVELQNVRGGKTALGRGRIQRRSELVGRVERRLPMDDPDMVARVHRHTDGGAQDPVIR